MKDKRPDLLLKDTVEDILMRFEVGHAFPKDFLKEEKQDGFWKKMWRSIGSCFGARRRSTPDVRGKSDRPEVCGPVAGLAAGGR